MLDRANGTPFTAKVIREVKGEDGCWSSLDMGVYQDDKLIGTYNRNYHSYGVETFAPFKYGDEYYALYSKEYTGTRVMRLPDCVDISEKGYGFCPVDLYVPWRYVCDVHDDDELTAEEKETYCECHSWHYPPAIGWVAGCFWGDDSSWKIEAFDLSDVQKGILRKLRPFGEAHMDADSLLKAVKPCFNPNYVEVSFRKTERIKDLLKGDDLCHT